jgi:hypothetical protein
VIDKGSCILLLLRSDGRGESLTVALRDEKEPMVSWAKRQWFSALGGEQLDEWQLYVEGRERAYGFLGEESGLRWEGNSWTSGNCTLRDGKEAMVRVLLGEEMGWSALEGEQLDEWQLYVEGRERSYGTFAGR